MTQRQTLFHWFAGVALLLAVAAAPPAQTGGGTKAAKEKTKTQPAKDEAKKPATHKVEKQPFRIEVVVKSILEPAQTTPILHHPEPLLNVPYSPMPMTIRTIVGHGASVRKGDVIAAFDTRKIDAAIEQVETDLRGLTTALLLAEKELPHAVKSAPLDLEAAEKSKREADEDLAYFLKTGKPEAEKRANQYVRMAQFYYEFSKEQLKQLEKMYKANDLTEETEQIILKRQRFFVEESALELKMAETERDYVLKTTLPRREKSLRDLVVRQALLLEKTRDTTSLSVAQKEQALAKMRFDAVRLRRGLEMLQRERRAMSVAAPVDGVVYYGKFSGGQWESSPALVARLAPGGTVQPEETYLTIVQSRPLLARLPIDEKDAQWIKAGMEGKVETVFDPDERLPAKIVTIAATPTVPGKYEAVASIEPGKGRAHWMPGQACAVKLVPYHKKDAIAVPAAAVFEEDDRYFVYVVDGKGKEQKRDVRPGRTSGDRREVLAGLTGGEEILLERPATKAAAPTGAEGGSQ